MFKKKPVEERSKQESPKPEPAPIPSVVWHPTAEATIYGWRFTYNGGAVYVRDDDSKSFIYNSMIVHGADELEGLGKAALRFAEHIRGIKSFTES